MKKKISVFIIIAILSYGVYWAFFDMSLSRLPEGDLIVESKSPNGEYIIKAYKSSGGATTGFAVLGELNYNTVNKKSKNIYWNYHEDTASIEWINNDTAIINGHRLNVLQDTFDFRRSK